MTNLDYYQILRLQPTAAPEEIRKAYRDLSILFRGRREPIAREIRKLVTEAYYELSDPMYRAEYDLRREIQAELDAEEEDQAPYQPELTEAERIISSWGAHFTEQEQEYLEKIHMINRGVRQALFVIAIIFIWLVVSDQMDIAFMMIFGVWFLRNMIWSIYRIKNPPPPPEVWATE